MQKTHSSGPARACDPTLDMAITGLMAALVFTGTYFFKIPTAFGYTHLGDCMIILTVCLFGTRRGMLAGAIGAGLSDFIAGYAAWVLPTIVLKGGKKKLDVARICYVEVQDHVLIYHTLDGDFETKGTMRDTDNQFNPKRYFRCNRCYLVNLEFVETYQGSDIMVNGDTIQVSRSRRKPFLDALNEYMNEVGK